jgi:hypothetical protein
MIIDNDNMDPKPKRKAKPKEVKDKDALGLADRIAEVIPFIIMWAMFGFLYNHQRSDSGFFTAEFGAMEQFLLYGPIFASMIAPIVRAGTGYRNPARLFEAGTNLFLAVGSLHLLNVFPFEYAHLADTLPGWLEFSLAWVTNDIARIFLIIQIIIGPIIALVQVWQYFWTIQRRAFQELNHRPF